MVLDQALVSGSNFVLGVVLTRLLGIASYGTFVLLWLVVVFLNSIQLSLLIAPMFTLVPKRPSEQRDEFVSLFVWQQIVFAGLSAALILVGGSIYAYFLFRPYLQYIPGLALGALMFLLQDFLRRALILRKQLGVALLVDVVAYVGQLVLLALLYFFYRLNVEIALWAIAGSFGLAVAIGIPRLQPLRWSSSSVVAAWQEAWRFSGWLTASSVTQWFAGNLFIVAAGSLLGAAAAGAVRVCQNLVGVAHVLFLALENYVPARAARLMKDRGISEMMKFFYYAGLAGGVVTGLALAVVGGAPRFWLRMTYGPGLQQYGYVLRWFAFLYLLVFVGTMLRFVLRTLEATKPFFVSSVATAAISLALAYPVVGAFGIPGVMVGMTVVQLVTIGYFGYEVYRRVP